MVNVPHARDSHAAVWTGSEMIVWGGAYWMARQRYFFEHRREILRTIRRDADAYTHCNSDPNGYANCDRDASSNSDIKSNSDSESSTDATPAPVEIIN
jgi:hypothetical protein